MKILITGAAGQLGTELRRQLEQGKSALGEIPEKLRRATVLCTDIGVEGMRELDITNRHEVAAFVRHHQPDVIICCAAYTNVDGCETHREDAFRVNALGPRNLAMAAEEIGAKLIHVSTDYVFSGVDNGGVALDEACGTCPVSAYGQTKLLGEEYVRQFCSRSFVVRTAWLNGQKLCVYHDECRQKVRQADGCKRPARQPHQRRGFGTSFIKDGSQQRVRRVSLHGRRCLLVV